MDQTAFERSFSTILFLSRSQRRITGGESGGNINPECRLALVK